MKNKFISAMLAAALLSVTVPAVHTFAETTSVEQSTEATTEAPSIIVNNADGSTIPVTARACMLLDASTGTVIYSKNADEKLYPASITKILTTYLACENGNMSDTITFSHNAIFNIGPGSSHIGMKEGEQINFKDALYGIMLASANEVCMAVAEHIDGSVDKFVERMNKQVADWGLKDTHFANPHGFHDENHYTTAHDMAFIAYHAVQNEQFSQIWGTATYKIPATNLSEERPLSNKDKMIRPTSNYYYQYIKGGKTGFHDDAKNTLVSYAEKDGIKLISVVMKDDGYEAAYTDSKNLLDYGFNQFSDVEIYKGDYTSTADIYQSYKGLDYNIGKIKVSAPTTATAKLPKFLTADKMTVEPVIDKAVYAPIDEGKEIGSLNVIYDGNTIASVPLQTAQSYKPESTLKLCFRHNWNSWGHYVILALKVMIISLILLVTIFIALYIRGLSIRSRKRKRRAAARKNAVKLYPDGRNHHTPNRPVKKRPVQSKAKSVNKTSDKARRTTASVKSKKRNTDK